MQTVGNSARIYGLTGPIGSGKSEVTDYFARQGVHIIDADLLSRQAADDNTVQTKLKEEFGETIFSDNGKLNRRALREIVFNNPDKKETLEEIIHPAINIRYKQMVHDICLKESSPLIIYSAALLFQGKNAYPEHSGVIVVTASPQTCIKRITQRDTITEADAVRILKQQMSVEEQEKRADFVIKNDGSKEELHKACDLVLKQIYEQATEGVSRES